MEIARNNNQHDDNKQSREFSFQSGLAGRKFSFEAESKVLELAAKRAEQQADRNVRQRIEFEKNVTQLLDKDPTGALATQLVNFVDARFGALQRPEQQDPVTSLLQSFMNKYS